MIEGGSSIHQDMEDYGDLDPYGVLKIKQDATGKDVKRAYHKMCLKYHPDKSEGFRKEFDRVQIAYLVLNDSKRRKLYDTKGKICPWGPVNDWEAWGEHLNDQFEDITKDLIEKDRKQYQGSEEERGDVKTTWVQFKGDFEKLFENIIHLEFSEKQEQRMVDICESLLANDEVKEKEVPKWKTYLKNRTKNINKMKKRAAREAKMASDVSKNDDLASLQALIAKNSMKNRQTFSDIFDRYETKGEDEELLGEDEEEEDEEEEEGDYSEAEEDEEEEDDEDDEDDEDNEKLPPKKKRRTK